MSEWSHLPNAPHIDRVLEHVRDYPEKWTTARSAARDAARAAAWAAARDGAARDVVRHVARDAAWDAARDAAWAAAWDAAWAAARDAARDAAWGAAVALVAWDDCAYMLDIHPDALQMLIETGDETTRHQAVLLLPAATALSNERSTT